MTQEEEIAHLKAQLSAVLEHLSKSQEQANALVEKVRVLHGENQALQEQLAAAQQRIEELEKQKMPSPTFVKANSKKSPTEEKKPRRYCSLWVVDIPLCPLMLKLHSAQDRVPAPIAEWSP